MNTGHTIFITITAPNPWFPDDVESSRAVSSEEFIQSADAMMLNKIAEELSKDVAERVAYCLAHKPVK